MSLQEAKAALDHVIRASRVHMYKPIQIAEILYRQRAIGDLVLEDVETYRNPSKRWRDRVSSDLVGSVSTSSMRYQDDVFSESAVPPRLLKKLDRENTLKDGIVEAYIYANFGRKMRQLIDTIRYAEESTPSTFQLATLLGHFRAGAGLRRSIDKVYEIVVYALFNTLVEALDARVTLTINETKTYLISEFEEFARMVLGVDGSRLSFTTNASLYRVGVTNAADRGLDMWANFGPAIQVKHLTLDPRLAQDIVGGISADSIVVVCRDCEKEPLKAVLMQLGFGNRIRGIIVESELASWYDRALRGPYSGELASNLLACLRNELKTEFPSYDNFFAFIESRGYHRKKLSGIWTLEGN